MRLPTLDPFRLPLFQGAASAYIIPLLIISSADSTFCSSSTESNSDSGKLRLTNQISSKCFFN